MDWFKKHGDTIIILGTFAACFWDMNEKINEIVERINERFNEIDKRFSILEKDIAVIKAVMLMKGMLPSELANCPTEK